ncbi:MAG: helix-turn-helix domain-containing protein [Microcoleus sp.]
MKTNHDLTEDLENTVTTGSGNVYADLGYDNPEEMLLKAQLVRLLSQAIKAKGLNQYQAAEILGIDQPKVSALVRGQFRGYSLERLFRFLNAFDLDVEVSVKSKPENRARSYINQDLRRHTTYSVPKKGNRVFSPTAIVHTIKNLINQ